MNSQTGLIRRDVAKLVQKAAGRVECDALYLARVAEALVQAAAELYEAISPGRGAGEMHATAIRLAALSAASRAKPSPAGIERLGYSAARDVLNEGLKRQHRAGEKGRQRFRCVRLPKRAAS